ncbi:hypothetical protein D3C75_571000 [compost metagenome]
MQHLHKSDVIGDILGRYIRIHLFLIYKITVKPEIPGHLDQFIRHRKITILVFNYHLFVRLLSTVIIGKKDSRQ